MKLSVLIPAHNEEESLPGTLKNLYSALSEKGISHEILVVNDNSTDGTEKILLDLKNSLPGLVYVNNQPPNGFGNAIRCGLENYSGDCVAIVMADGSDDPMDLLAFYKTMVEGNYDAVFGSRFIKGGTTYDYPKVKLIVNRLANLFIRSLFGLKYNDVTNAFKLYRRNTIDGLKPLLSPHFNLTVELPLKVIVRKYSYTWLPNSWTNRTKGQSKLKIKEMGSRYLFVVLYCLIEKYFSRGDYLK